MRVNLKRRTRLDRAIGAVIVFVIFAGITKLITPFVIGVAHLIPEHPPAVVPTIFLGLLWLTFAYATIAMPILVMIEET